MESSLRVVPIERDQGNEVFPKLKDPDSFSIPCLVGNVSIDHALCDL